MNLKVLMVKVTAEKFIALLTRSQIGTAERLCERWA
jgi:hypothetical protein